MTGDAPGRESGARSRALLRQIRIALARAGDGVERLDRIVRLIANNMVAEVCSIYILGAERQLTLVATEGLNRKAINRASLAVGEGLVGRIAESGETINTDDAVNTEGFRLLPEVGEEAYRSFLGTPIRRQGHTLGVLVVQNRTARIYDEEEIDALELIATVIAEMTEAGALFDVGALGARRSEPVLLRGAAAADGVAMGQVVLHEPKIVLARPIADDLATERRRLAEAMDSVRGEIDKLIDHVDVRGSGEHRDVLETFRMFANDRGWLRRLEDAVDSGLAAESAVEKVQNETRARMERVNDPYLRERLADLDELANRMLRALLGVAPPSPDDLPDDSILVGRSLGPGELLEYGRGKLKGVALEEGSAGSHAAIVARALNVPLVTSLAGLIDATDAGEPIIVDGDLGHVLLRPEATVTAAYLEKLTLREQEQEALRALRDLPAETTDGARISLRMNAGLLSDLPSIDVSGAEGVGLYRTELQYLVTSRAPRRDAQARLYEKVLNSAGEKPVVFRTLDMGGDKQLPFLKGEAEENPALGWRAIRIALDRPLLFRMQLQALVWAAAGRSLRVMFPMVADVSEFDRAREMLLTERERAEKSGRTPPTELKIGVMLETPALAFAAPQFYERLDFVSVGGNDLLQFFFAADRGNERVRGRYDPLSCAFLRLLQQIVARAEAGATPLSFCGEMAGKPLEAIALSAVGFRTLSMRPASIGPVKRALRSVDLAGAKAVIDAALEEGRDGVRAALTAWCGENGVVV